VPVIQRDYLYAYIAGGLAAAGLGAALALFIRRRLRARAGASPGASATAGARGALERLDRLGALSNQRRSAAIHSSSCRRSSVST